MAANSTPHTVGEIDSFIALLGAACDDGAVHRRLTNLLALPAPERGAIVQSWVTDLVITGAPQPLVVAVGCLLDEGVAEKAREVIAARTAPAPPGRADRAGRWFVAAVVSLLAAGCTWLTAKAYVAGFVQGLDSPRELADLVPLALFTLISVAPWVAVWSWFAPQPRPARHYLRTGLVLSSAICTVLFVVSLTLMPVNGCRDGEEAMALRQALRAVRAFSACLALPTLTPAARAAALKGLAWGEARLQKSQGST